MAADIQSAVLQIATSNNTAFLLVYLMGERAIKGIRTVSVARGKDPSSWHTIITLGSSTLEITLADKKWSVSFSR